MPTINGARPPLRLGPRGRRVFDVVLVLLLLAAAGATYSDGRLATALSVAQSLPLFARRSRPFAVFVAVAALSALQVVVLDRSIVGQLAFPIAIYSAARFGKVWQGRTALAVGLCAAVVASIDWDSTQIVGAIVALAAIVFAAWASGNNGRTRQVYLESLVERGEQMAAESAQRARLAAAQERTRIAREMHDVVAHGMSVMVVQADGARYASAADPELAVTTLAAIARTGRESLTEMRRLLGLLRGDDGAAELVPQPRLADLVPLVEQNREAGLTVELLPIEGSPPTPVDAATVPEGVQLTVYRVVQESLTNVRKHAGVNARATIVVSVDPSAVEVRVRDDGRGAAAPGGPGGFGLLGMRERVAVHDGRLDAGPAPGGGWLVQARIPL